MIENFIKSALAQKRLALRRRLSVKVQIPCAMALVTVVSIAMSWAIGEMAVSRAKDASMKIASKDASTALAASMRATVEGFAPILRAETSSDRFVEALRAGADDQLAAALPQTLDAVRTNRATSYAAVYGAARRLVYFSGDEKGAVTPLRRLAETAIGSGVNVAGFDRLADGSPAFGQAIVLRGKADGRVIGAAIVAVDANEAIGDLVHGVSSFAGIVVRPIDGDETKARWEDIHRSAALFGDAPKLEVVAAALDAASDVAAFEAQGRSWLATRVPFTDVFGSPLFAAALVLDVTVSNRAAWSLEKGDLAVASAVATTVAVVAICIIWLIRVFRPLEHAIDTMTQIVMDQAAPDLKRLERAADRDDEIGRISGAVRKVVEVMGERRALQRSAEHEALHDPLTGLANRRHLERVLRERVARSAAGSEPPAVLHIDLDRFKEINDMLGHAAGDFVLQHVAAELRTAADADDLVARIGGDEFVILTSSARSRPGLEALAQKLIDRLSGPVLFGKEMCHVGASIGIDVEIGEAEEPAGEAGTILANADIALYRAKELGRGQFQFFTRDLRNEAERRKTLSDELLTALEQGDIVPFYQGQFDAQSGALCGAEALARWRHPTQGLLGPGVIMQIADRLGVGSHVDAAILRKSLDDLAEWDALGVRLPSLSVNLSAKRLTDPDLLPSLRALTIPRGRVNFEILESFFSDQIDEKTQKSFDFFREIGVQIDMDDFGTGHSSLVSLLSVSPNRIKVPRELVKPCPESTKHAKLVNSIVDIAKFFGIDVIAEGVENQEQARFLQAAGCSVLQGYYYAKPCEASDFIAFARTVQLCDTELAV